MLNHSNGNENGNQKFPQRNNYCALPFFLEYNKHNKNLIKLHVEQGKIKEEVINCELTLRLITIKNFNQLKALVFIY